MKALITFLFATLSFVHAAVPLLPAHLYPEISQGGGIFRPMPTNIIGLDLVAENGMGAFWTENGGPLQIAPNTEWSQLGLENVRQVSATDVYALALLNDGRVVTASRHVFDPVAYTPPRNATNIISISAGHDHVLAARANGTVLSWGPALRNFGFLTVPEGIDRVVEVATTLNGSIVRRSDGSIFGWGQNIYGHLSFPVRNDVIAIATGWYLVMALSREGTVSVYGEAAYQPPPGLRDVVAIAAHQYQCYALTREGKIVTWPTQVDLSGVTAVRRIFASRNHIIAWTEAPVIWAQPKPLVLRRGETARFEVVAQSLLPLSYQWFRNGVPIAGANDAVLEFPASESDEGAHHVRVSNEFHSIDSQPATLHAGRPIVTVPPYTSAPERGSVEITAQVISASPATFQWYFQNLPLAGQTRQTLRLENLRGEQNGDYYVRVANADGQVFSGPAGLAVTATPYVDQSQLREDSTTSIRENYTVFRHAQTFTAGITGRLNHVVLKGCAEPFLVRILAVDASGLPTSAILGSAVSRAGACDDPLPAYFSQNIFLRAGQKYAIEVIPNSIGLLPPEQLWPALACTYGSSYPDGQLLVYSGNRWVPKTIPHVGATASDFWFETHVFPGIPSAQLVAPAPSDRATSAQTVTLRAVSLLDPPVDIARVNYFADGVEIAEATLPPFEAQWHLPAPGERQITARVLHANGFWTIAGTSTLYVRPPAPVNDDFSFATQLLGNHADGQVRNTGATIEPFEPRAIPASAGKSVWWKWTAINTGPVFATTHNSSDPALILSVHSGQRVDLLSPITNGITRCEFAAIAGQTYHFAVDSMSADDHDIVLNISTADVRIVAPTPTVVRAPATLSFEASTSTQRIASVSITANGQEIARFAQTPYRATATLTEPGFTDIVAVATDDRGVVTRSNPVRVTIRPQNDNFANATSLAGYSGQVRASNRAATHEALDIPTGLQRAENQGSRSIWYSWQAPASGILALHGSGLPSGIYWIVGIRGGNGIALVSHNQDFYPHPPLQTRVTAGVLYYFKLDSTNFEEAIVDWSYSLRPFNDNINAAYTLEGEEVSVLASARNCAIEPDEPPLPAAAADLGTLWWDWFPPTSGATTVSLSLPEGLAGLSIFRGHDPSDLSLVAEAPADDSAAVVTFPATHGALYRIRANVDPRLESSLTLNLSMESLRFTSPLPQSAHRSSSSILLAARFLSDRPLATLRFFLNGQPAEGTPTPAGILLPPLPAGSYRLTAQAVDATGATYDSAPTTFLVYNGSETPRARLFAGPAMNTSIIVDAVGSVRVMGDRPSFLAPFSHQFPWLAATATSPPGVSGWRNFSGRFAGGPGAGPIGIYGISNDGFLFNGALLPVQGPWIDIHSQPDDGGQDAVFYTVDAFGRVFIRGQTPAPLTEDLAWKSFRKGFSIDYGLTVQGEIWMFGAPAAALERKRLPFPSGVTSFTKIDVTAETLVALGNNFDLYETAGSIVSPQAPARVSRPAEISRWADFSCGGYHTLAISDNGRLFSWGLNNAGQLGYIYSPDISRPARIQFPQGVTAFTAFAAGYAHSFAIGNDGALYSWGSNEYGQLGLNGVQMSYTPQLVPGISNANGQPIVFFEDQRARRPDGTFEISFNTILNRPATIQYSHDMESWISVIPSIPGNGQRVTWLDDGPPKTESHPAVVPTRYYRVISQ